MSRFITNIGDGIDDSAVGFGGYAEAKKSGRFRKVLLIVGVTIAVIAGVGAAAGYFYWQSLKDTPQYSLALIVDAARNNDQSSIDQLVDTGAVVDDFMPQITSKAVEIYGRGLPPETIARVAQVAGPVLPAVKDKARGELPGLIRRKAEKFDNVPFAAMVVGAGRYLDMDIQGGTAIVKSRLPGHSFEVRMARNGDRWKIVGVRDNDLAERIAKAIGQEFIVAALAGGPNVSGESLGIKNLNDLLKNAEEALK
ncbi:MAG TPA: hypothetical protein VK468_00620 [Pyrinomonadaceae bacterium]|nr:hypothetical protein [Pyrinomonadaceae bacterium]